MGTRNLNKPTDLCKFKSSQKDKADPSIAFTVNREVSFVDVRRHKRSQGGERGHDTPKFLENIVILCIERRFSKQNSVIRLKSNTLAPQIFGLATPLFGGLFFRADAGCLMRTAHL